MPMTAMGATPVASTRRLPRRIASTKVAKSALASSTKMAGKPLAGGGPSGSQRLTR